ncbi:hypothetical protein [Rhizobium sp. SGZ-381]|uniref:hypothetical protein n=1 Tax=Rhizobium sp. SGZ-381 TaxID=3342800 RepID=UPI00366AACA8
MFEYIKLFVENLWSILAVFLVAFIILRPDMLRYVSKITLPGGVGIELQKLRDELEKQGQDIKVLETELSLERHNLQTVIESFDSSSPMSELIKVRKKLKSHAGQITDSSQLKSFLSKEASPEELYSAAVILRETRPVELIEPLIDCLQRLANSSTLDGIRLNTVWTLTSALHRMLIANIRDKAGVALSEQQLRRARDVLKKLERNAKVQFDNPMNPDRGVRGPIKNALSWIEKGLDVKP